MNEEEQILFYAAIIVAIRTARIDCSKFSGMQTPHVRSEVANSIALARLLVETQKRIG